MNGLRDLAAELGGLRVVELPAVDEHPDLTSGLDRVGLLNAWEAQYKRFELFESPYIFFQGFAPCAGAAGADCVGGGNEKCIGRLDPQIVMVT